MDRIAKSLETLREQVNAVYPNRSKVSDGWIGDPAHQERKSDHNPNAAGVVQALDITHDPRPGVGPDTWKLAEILRLNQDKRIKYCISNGRIFSSEVAPWTWREYNGDNKHDKHIHVSVSDVAALYDDGSEWDLTPPEQGTAPAPVATDIVRREMASRIVDFEARRENGKIAVYNLTDGTFEVAGINNRYHADEAADLRTLINAGKHTDAEQRAGEYILKYTDAVLGWTTHPGLEFYLRDSMFNRGPTGAAIILQKALNVQEDGQVGPLTRGALNAADPNKLLEELRIAREEYEIEKYGRREHLWRGLTNRWNNALATARVFAEAAKPTPPVQPPPVVGEPGPEIFVPPPPTPPAVEPPAPPPADTPFIGRIEQTVAEIMGEKDKIGAALARLKVLSGELTRRIDEGIT